MGTTAVGRRPALVAVLALLLSTVAVVGWTTPALADVQAAAGQYVALTPARIVSAASVAAAGTYALSPMGKGGVPATGVTAVAFQLSTHSTGSGWLEAFPAGVTRPNASSVNYTANVWTTNAVVSKLGTGGQVSIYNGGTAAAPLYVDVMGYYGTGGATYVPLTPVRIASSVSVTAGGTYAVPPLGTGGVPATNVSAVAMHVSFASTTAGSLTVYPDGVTRPGTADLNYGTDGRYTNQVTAKLGSTGKFQVYSTRAGTLTIDIDGYYQAPAGTAAGSTFVGVTPSRVLNGVILAGNTTTSYQLAGTGGVPATGAAAVAFNLTGTDQGVLGVLTVYAADATLPVTRELSYHVGGTWPTLQVSKLSADGKVSVHNTGTGAVRLLLDVTGYYKAATAPATPTAVTAVADNGGATVSWTRPADGGASITKYTVTASPGGATAVATTGTSVRVAGLTNERAYTFTVTATNAAGTSPASAASAAVTPKGPPGQPFVTEVAARDGAAWVAWSPPPGAEPVTGYIVKASPGTATVQVSDVTRTQAVLTGLTNGTSYRLTVAAINTVGTGIASEPSRPVIPALAQLPLQPAVTAVTALNQRVDLQWVAPPDGGADVTSYHVTASPGGQVLTIPAGTTVASVTGLTNGTAYTFTVAAINKTGTGPATTTTATPVASRVPAAPVDIQVSVPTAGQLTAGWTAPSDAGTSAITGYTVTATPGGATVSVGATATTATLTGLTAATSYTLTVRAVSAAGTGVASAATPAMRPAFTGKRAPVVLSAASLASLRAVRDDGRLEFASPPAEVTGLTAGALVVATTGSLTPQGFFGKVTGVTTTGTTVVVSTVPAALDEAVADGSLAMQGQLTDADVESFTASVPGVHLAEPTIGGKTVKNGAATADGDDDGNGESGGGDAPAVGLRDGALVVEWQTEPVKDELGVTSNLELQMQLKPGFTHTQQVTSAGTSSTLTVTGDVQLQALGKIGYVHEWESEEKELGRINGKCVRASIGWLPVFICPRFIVTGQVKIDAGGGVAFSVSYGRAVTASITVLNGAVTSTATSSRLTTPFAPTVSVFGEASVTAELHGTMGFFLYGAIGPSVVLKPYLQLFADTTQSPWWELRGGLRVTTALKSDKLFGKKIDYESGNLVDVFDSLLQAPGGFTGLQITPSDPRTQASSTLKLGVTIVGYPVNIPITWSVVRGPGSIDSTGLYTPAGVGAAEIKAQSPAVVGSRPLLTASTAILVGPGHPGVPFRVTATPGSFSADVSWQPPVSDGGSPITGYVLTTYPPTTTVRVPATTSAATITGLQVGQEYQIQVFAVNAIGTSEAGTPGTGFLRPLDGSFLPLGSAPVNIIAGDPYAGGAGRLSRDGRYAIYLLEPSSPFAPSELAGKPSGWYLVRKDLITGAIVLASKSTDGTPVIAGFEYDIDGSGTVVAYETTGTQAKVLVNNLATNTVTDFTTGKITSSYFTVRLSSDSTTMAVTAEQPTGNMTTAYRIVVATGAITPVGKCGVAYTCTSYGIYASPPPTLSQNGRYMFFQEENPRADISYIGSFLYDSTSGSITELHVHPLWPAFDLPTEMVHAVSADISTLGGTNRLANGVTGEFVKRGLTAAVTAADMVFTDVPTQGLGGDVLQFSDDGQVAVVRQFDVSTHPIPEHTSIWVQGGLYDLPDSESADNATVSGDGRVVLYDRSVPGIWVQRLT